MHLVPVCVPENAVPTHKPSMVKVDDDRGLESQNRISGCAVGATKDNKHHQIVFTVREEQKAVR